MKVVAAVPLYPPTSRVGAWLSTHECLLELAGRGHDVTVVRQLGGTKPRYDYDDLPVLSLPGHRADQRVADADLLISHVGDNGRAHRVAVEAGVPSVRMCHGGAITPEKLAGASLVVWNSTTYAATCAWAGPQIVVYPPVRAEQHRTTPGDAVTLVNLSDAKGVRTFWKAAERLPDVSFLGVKGQIGQQNVPRVKNVEVMATQRDMRNVWSRTRVLLMPSEVETWGRVGVEAMASGIPVVAHPTPGLRESLGDAGIFVDRDDIDGWVRQIQRLVGRPSTWSAASKLALRRSRQLDPQADLDRFVAAVEALAPADAARPADQLVDAVLAPPA